MYGERSIGGCTATCNGKPRTTVWAEAACSSSAVQVGNTVPTDDCICASPLFYSKHCKTIWATIQNTRAIGRTYCQYYLHRFLCCLSPQLVRSCFNREYKIGCYRRFAAVFGIMPYFFPVYSVTLNQTTYMGYQRRRGLIANHLFDCFQV